MKNLFLFFLMTGCSMHRTSINGTVDVIDGDWCTVEVDSATSAAIWVKINRKKMKDIKEGDRVVFYIKVEESD